MLKTIIREAFAETPYPGDAHLRGSDVGEDPYEVEAAFRGKTDWRILTPEFLDRHYDALSFLSGPGLRFYLPAYLLADLDSKLMTADPLFCLWYGFDNEGMRKVVNPVYHGDQTWFEVKREMFATFTAKEARAIVAYMRWRQPNCILEQEKRSVDEAIHNFWLEKAGE
jgi:hypothetical protein